MRAVNLYMLTRNRDSDCYTPYENMLSARTEPLRVREHEFNSLIRLVELLVRQGVDVCDLEGFYYAYTIRQIGKEFDLLKIHRDKKVLNIELKSQSVPGEKIEKQLQKNRYYLSCIAPELYLFTYVDETGVLYTLKEGVLKTCDPGELVHALKSFVKCETGDIDELFRVRDYLISPLNMPEKFIEDRYFLTQQQDTIKNEILAEMEKDNGTLFWGITGMAGTGKTLLLYDMAKDRARESRCCILHIGRLCRGHMLLNGLLKQIDIIDDKMVQNTDLGMYGCIFVDEAQRMSEETLRIVVDMAEIGSIPVIFSYDFFQTLSKTEQRRNIPGRIQQLKGFQERKLSGRIRSNEEMGSFIRMLLDLNDTSGKHCRYDAVDVVYASDVQEAETIIRYYCDTGGYIYIEYDDSVKHLLPEDSERVFYARDVIGQEFDRVVIRMDGSFYYNDEGKLQGRNHPNPDYIYDRLFFQGVSRTREKLCIVVMENVQLFEHIIYEKYKKSGLDTDTVFK